MRKLLLIFILLLLIVMGVAVATRGILIKNLKILSIAQMEEQNNNLNTKIEELNTIVDTDYPKKMAELNTAYKNWQSARDEYLDITNLSSDEAIIAAIQGKTYEIEYLWTSLGTHARENGVVLKFEITASSTGASNVNDIKFTVDGSYIATINFIYSIENDTNLAFRIENFKMTPIDSGEKVESTFTVRNVTVEGVSSASTSSEKDTTMNTPTNNTQEGS